MLHSDMANDSLVNSTLSQNINVIYEGVMIIMMVMMLLLMMMMMIK